MPKGGDMSQTEYTRTQMPYADREVTVSVANAQAHQWYTYPTMNRSEVLVFRTFDSRLAASGDSFWTPHSAFIDNSLGTNEPARETVAMPALCLFY